MSRIGYVSVLLALFLGATATNAQQGDAKPLQDPNAPYVPGPDSLPQPQVPKGEVFSFVFSDSKIFPGTSRMITVYVPQEYTADKPACVYVGLDGLGFEAPTVFDNLIYKHQMPITIAVGVEPGSVASTEPNEDPRFNRSFEFDGLSGDLGRFLLEEIFPAVEEHTTKAGKKIRLSIDPNDRAVGGASTGGIGAFTLAWDHPDEFRRVFSAIGTYVGMRGGDRYPVLIRKTDPKPIRIFMQDGSRDGLDGFLPDVGDWWMTNQAMERALEYAGYDVNHVWGGGTHNVRQATSVFPDAMRWLWRDWPQPIRAGQSKNTFMQAILMPGEDWQEVAGDYQSTGGLATEPKGEVVFQNAFDGRALRLSDHGAPSPFAGYQGAYSQMAFDKEGQVYVNRGNEILEYHADGKSTKVARSIQVSQMLITDTGLLYATEAGATDADGKVWLIRPGGERIVLDSGLHHPTGIALSPDGLWLSVTEGSTHWGYSYQVQKDGTVKDKQRFYWFHIPDSADDSGAKASAMDRDGRLYVATRMGVQVLDRNGRSRVILPVPGGEITGISFGGQKFDELYVSCANKRIYRRKMKVAGAPAWLPPIQLPQWSPA